MRQIIRKALVAAPAGLGAVFLAAIAVSPDVAGSNLQKWAEAIGLLVPGWVADKRTAIVVVVAIGLFYLWWFRHRLPFEIRRKGAPSGLQNPDKATLLDQVQRQAKVERELHLDEKADFLARIKSLEERLAHEQGELRQCKQLWAFGADLTRVPEIDANKLEAARVALAKLAPDLGEMFTHAEGMWRAVSGDVLVAGQSTALPWLHDYISYSEHRWFHNIGQLFWRRLEESEDLRPVFGLLCVNYFKLRRMILLLADLTGVPAVQRAGYANWRQAEVAFFGDLRKTVAIPEVDPVRQDIRAYFGGMGITIRYSLPVEELVLPPIASKPNN